MSETSKQHNRECQKLGKPHNQQELTEGKVTRKLTRGQNVRNIGTAQRMSETGKARSGLVVKRNRGKVTREQQRRLIRGESVKHVGTAQHRSGIGETTRWARPTEGK